MTINCYCDYDPPEFCHAEIRKARKERRCTECGGKILAGERYEHTRGKWEGSIDTFDLCERCFDIRTWVKNSLPCFCWAYGHIVEDAKEAVEEAYWAAPEEAAGLRFGLLRRIVKRRRLNRERRAA